MKRILVAALSVVLPASYASVGPAMADEVIIHRDAPDVVDVPAPSHDVVIERRRPDCATTTVRRENGYGDSTTTTRRDCD